MKKTVLFLSTLVVLAWACKKDDEPEPNPTPTPTPYQITSSDMPNAGDEFYMPVYTLVQNDTFTIGGAPGQSLVWVYNPIPFTTQVDTTTFGSPSNHPDGAFFTGANLYIDSHDGTFMFLDKQSDRVDITGIWMVVNGDTLKGNLSDKYTVMKFPMQYGSTFTDSGFVTINSTYLYQGQTLPAKYEASFKVISNCNGEGNITIPLGSFKCLREKRTEYTSFKFSVQVLTQWTQFFSTADTTYSYTFHSKDKKWDIAKLTTDISDKVLTLSHLTE